MKKATKATATYNRLDFEQVKGLVKMARKLNMDLDGLLHSIEDWEAQDDFTVNRTPWKRVGNSFICGNCGALQDLPSNYCPGCGNKMATPGRRAFEYEPE